MDLKNYQFFMKADLSKYMGKWVAILNQKIIAADNNPKKVYEAAHKLSPKRIPFIARVPEKGAMIFWS